MSLLIIMLAFSIGSDSVSIEIALIDSFCEKQSLTRAKLSACLFIALNNSSRGILCIRAVLSGLSFILSYDNCGSTTQSTLMNTILFFCIKINYLVQRGFIFNFVKISNAYYRLN